MTTGFHEVRFPLDIALGSSGGPRRRTDIVTTGSGREIRNARWHHSRRHYDAGYGVKSIEALAAVVAFFEERRGRLYGFRWHDRLDCRSGSPNAAPTPLDQLLGAGDGQQASFQLAKTYGGAHDPYIRPVRKPVAGTVRVVVAGQEQVPGADFTCDPASGLVTFAPNRVPPAGAAVTAGFAFDVPVRFDADELDVDLSAFDAGAIPRIPLVEILL